MVSAEHLQRRLLPMAAANERTLVLHEIYRSIQGESSYVGLPCVFVRTTACHLRCSYCDTRHAFTEGKPWALEDVLREVGRLAPTPQLVEVTGGEPLLQPAVPRLLSALCDAGHTVLLETSGSLDIGSVDPRVVRIVDFKTPSSGEVDANLYSNIDKLTARDEVKLVIGGRDDYDWSRDLLMRHELPQRCLILMGPVWGTVDPEELAAWILADGLRVRMQLQLHKVIWKPATRGV